MVNDQVVDHLTGVLQKGSFEDYKIYRKSFTSESLLNKGTCSQQVALLKKRLLVTDVLL